MADAAETRVRVIGPDGITGTVPAGTALPAGWRLERAAPTTRSATAAAPHIPTWAERLGVENAAGRSALDLAEGVASVVPTMVFSGGDAVRRTLGMPRVMNDPAVQQAMHAPDSTAGAVGHWAPMALPLAYGAVTAPVLTAAGLGTSWAGGALTRPVATATAQALGASPEQAEGAGDIGEFVGGSLAGMLGPAAVTRLRARTPVAADRRAMQYAVDAGLPVDAATASGNQAVIGARWLADRTIGGSTIATRADARTRQAWTRHWDTLAGRTGVPTTTDPFAAGARAQDAQATMREAIGRGYATAAEGIASRMGGSDQTARQTGTQTRNTIVGVVRQLRHEAEQAYDDAWTQTRRATVRVQTGTQPGTPSGIVDASGRAVSAAPRPVFDVIETPVDIRDLKSAPWVQELWDDMNELTLDSRNSSQAYASLKRLLEGPDLVSARAAERARSGLLALARTASSPDVRNVNQGNAAALAQALRTRINTAVEQYAGPDALQALERGRATHASKMQVADILDDVSKEGVQAFNKMTWSDDRGVGALEQLAAVAPDLMPQVGRTWFSQTVTKHVADGVLNLDKVRSLQADYARLGDDTKRLMFRNPQVRRQVDAWFANLSTGADAVGPRLATEPHAVWKQLLGANDSHAAQLQAIAKIAPDVPSLLLRAGMDDAAARVAAGKKIGLDDLSQFRTFFDQLGPRTLALAAPDPAFRRDLDLATRAMQRISDNPNRSGSGFMAALLLQAQQLLNNPLMGVGTQSAGAAVSALLRSPRLVRMMVRGTTMPNTPAAAQYAGTVMQALRAELGQKEAQ